MKKNTHNNDNEEFVSEARKEPKQTRIYRNTPTTLSGGKPPPEKPVPEKNNINSVQTNEEFVTEALKLPVEYIKRGFKAARRAHGGGMTKAAWESFDDETKAKIKKHAIAIAFSLHKKAKANARKANKKVKKESIEEGKALTFQQRLERSRRLRRIEPKVYRGQIRYQDRVPSQARLEKRAERMARNLIKMRISHTPYDQMSVPEKIMIDKILEKKQKAIKKLAQRLLPKVRKISMQRISGSQIPMQTVQYQSTDYDETLSMIESKLSSVEDNNLKESLQTIIALSTNEETPAVKSLRKKAEVAGVSFEEIVSVYAEAVSEYTPRKITSEQYAFNAVNAFVKEKLNVIAEGLLGSMLWPVTTRFAASLSSTPNTFGPSPHTMRKPIDHIDQERRSKAVNSFARSLRFNAGFDFYKARSHAKEINNSHSQMMQSAHLPKQEYSVGNREFAIRKFASKNNMNDHDTNELVEFDKHYHGIKEETIEETSFFGPQGILDIGSRVADFVGVAGGPRNAASLAAEIAKSGAKKTVGSMRRKLEKIRGKKPDV